MRYSLKLKMGFVGKEVTRVLWGVGELSKCSWLEKKSLVSLAWEDRIRKNNFKQMAKKLSCQKNKYRVKFRGVVFSAL